MSYQMVGSVIQRLLTDEQLRVLFALDPIEALADLSVLGFVLTPDEIDLFMRTDVRLWCWSRDLADERVH